MASIEDRTATRMWELDLSLVDDLSRRGRRPAVRDRQAIARFVGREGSIERFEIRQTIPYCGYEADCPPSQAQYGAVMDFYLEPSETRYQANTLLSARDYAAAVAGELRLDPLRTHLIWVSTAAFILADRDLRARVRAWNIARRSRGIGIGEAIRGHKPHRAISAFASALMADVRASGARIFG